MRLCIAKEIVAKLFRGALWAPAAWGTGPALLDSCLVRTGFQAKALKQIVHHGEAVRIWGAALLHPYREPCALWGIADLFTAG